MRLFAKALCALFLALAGIGGAAAETKPAGISVPVFTMAAFGRLLPSALLAQPDPALLTGTMLENGFGLDALSSLVQNACLALAVYHEARGEPLSAQRAVAVTIINRARSAAYPETVCGVVYDGASRPFKCQFSFACDGRSDVPENRRAVSTSVQVASAAAAVAPSHSPGCIALATHYHRHDVSPVWSKKLQLLGHMGEHLFFASDRVIRRMGDAAERREQAGRCLGLAFAMALEF